MKLLPVCLLLALYFCLRKCWFIKRDSFSDPKNDANDLDFRWPEFKKIEANWMLEAGAFTNSSPISSVKSVHHEYPRMKKGYPMMRYLFLPNVILPLDLVCPRMWTEGQWTACQIGLHKVYVHYKTYEYVYQLRSLPNSRNCNPIYEVVKVNGIYYFRVCPVSTYQQSETECSCYWVLTLDKDELLCVAYTVPASLAPQMANNMYFNRTI